MLLWAVLAFLFQLISRAKSYISRQPQQAWSEWTKPPAWLYSSAITTIGLYFKGTTVVVTVRIAIVKSSITRNPSLARIADVTAAVVTYNCGVPRPQVAAVGAVQMVAFCVIIGGILSSRYRSSGRYNLAVEPKFALASTPYRTRSFAFTPHSARCQTPSTYTKNGLRADLSDLATLVRPAT
jgi:hypothetical protein